MFLFFVCLFVFFGDSSFRPQQEIDRTFKQDKLGVQHGKEVEAGSREATGGRCRPLDKEQQ